MHSKSGPKEWYDEGPKKTTESKNDDERDEIRIRKWLRARS